MIVLRRLFQRTSRSSTTLGREFAIGDVIEQRYEVEQVRRGFMGIVYIAYDRQRRSRIAIKTFQNKFLWDAQAIERFSTEAELWMRLGGHPNIVRAYDLRTFLGKPHVIAEYVHGGPLRTLVGHLELQEAIDYAIQICWGMSHAIDRAAIMHRDLKPDNILVTLEGQAKVTDFGLARVLPMWQWPEHMQLSREVGRLHVHTGTAVGGTLPYMAPELFEPRPFAGVWSDIYAFGVMLFELFTGRLPFNATRDDSLIRMHREEPPPDPRELRPMLHRGTAHIVSRCLAKNYTERYTSFREVEHDLQLLRQHLFGERFSVTWPSNSDHDSANRVEQGLLHMELGEHSEALACFQQAVQLDGSRSETWLHLARARLRLWQYNEALAAIDHGLKHAVSRNEYGPLYQVLGETYAAMQRVTDAVKAFDKGLSYMPRAPGLWREKGDLLQRLGMAREAQRCLKQALKYDRLDPLTWRLLGDSYAADGQLKQASRAYAESLKLDPRSALGWARHGACLLRRNRAKEALRAFDAALKLDDHLQEAIDGARLARQRLR